MGSTASFQQPPAADDSDRTAAHVPPAFASSPDEPTVISNHPAHLEALGAALQAPSHDLAKLLAGEKLGHYELIEFAGGGGMGAVFRARDSMLHREVAIKVLSRDQAADEELLKRFKNEAQSAARLDHDNIARVYYVGEDRGLHYIVFEYVEGLNIRQLVDRDGPLPLPRAMSYVLQAADALAHASTRDVVHRDIKPSNIVITSQGKAKLVDMGLARFQGLQPGADLTASGVTLGTFDYISPEQARDPRTADVRSDIYSLGCTLYFMLTGRPPFPEGTVLQKLLQHNSDDPIDPREFNADLPDELSSLMRKMLAKDPARRYQTPSELIADMMHFAEPLGLNRREASLTWEQEAAPPTALLRHLTWLIPAVGLVLAFAVFESWERRTDRRWRDAWIADRSAEAAAAVAPAPVATPTPMPTTGATAPVETSSPPVEPVAVPTANPTATKEASAVTEATPPRSLPPPRDGVLVVCDEEGEGRFASLRSACFAARNGDVVELCFDGPRPEKPLILNNLKITVRAGVGYRPIVHFRPGDVVVPNAPHAMVTVVGGRIDWVGVDLLFDVPPPQDLPTDRWSLFGLQHAEHVGLDRVVVTVRNAAGDGPSYHPDAAVFGLSSPPGVAAMMNDDAPTTPGADPADVRLDHCLVRGEANLMRVAEAQSVSLMWENGLLAVADSALVVRGGQTMPRGPGVRLELRHVTAAVGGEFLRVVNDFEAPFLPHLTVRAADSTLSSVAGRPLLDFQGVDARSEILSDLDWSAERVVYDGFVPEAFWRVTSSVDGAQALSFDEWRLHWGEQRELQTVRTAVRWQSPTEERPPWQNLQTADFALDPADSRTVGAAGDGGDLGLNAALMRAPYDVAPRTDVD